MVDIIAHRGVSIEAPENTLAAFERAFDLGVDYVELDVRLNRDAIPAVIHDPSFNPHNFPEDEALLVENMSFAEIKALDAGSWFNPLFAGERIPSLEEVLLLNRKSSGLMIEIKEGKHSPFTTAFAVFSLLSKIPPSQHSPIIIGSFSPEILSAIQQESKSFPLIGILEHIRMVSPFLEMGIKHLALCSKVVNSALIRDLHQLKIKTWIYTVNNPDEAKELIKMGVDGIISDDPAKMMKLKHTN